MSSPTWAIPIVRVKAIGSCPSQSELTQAVAAKAWPQVSMRGNPRALPDYDIVSRADANGATLELRRSGGAVLITRRFASEDCRALADAMVVVVEAYFVDVGEPVPAGPRNPGATNPERTDAVLPPAAVTPVAATATPTATSPTSAVAPNQEPTSNGAATASRNPAGTAASNGTPPLSIAGTAAQPNGALPIAGTASASQPKGAPPIAGSVSQPKGTLSPRPIDAGTTPTAPTPTKAAEPSSTIAWMRGFIGIGASLALPPSDALRLVTPSAQLGAGVVFASIPLSTDVLVGSSLRSAAGERPNRIERWASHALVRAGWPLSKQPELRPWLGAGVQVASLRAIDLPDAQTRTRFSSLVGVGLEASMPIASNWSTQADLGCVLCGTREHYQVSPSESLGDGPRVICMGTLGVSFGKKP